MRLEVRDRAWEADALGEPSPPPVPLSTFIGREREIEQLTGLLASSRLVTLTGPGGCGKTRLALELAGRVGAGFPDGRAFVDLAPVREPALVESSLAAALGGAGGGLEGAAAQVGGARLLVVIDNVEHLLEAGSALVEGLLAACPNVRVLVTSRERLNVGGEVSWSVEPLPLPPVGGGLEPAELLGYDAVSLFCKRAAEQQGEFRLTAQNAGLVVAICRRLDGLPLALELAAARVKSLPLAEILRRLDDCFQLLTAGPRSAVARHRSMRAAVEWSYQLLEEGERRLLSELSAFAGTFTLEAVEAICPAGGGVAGAEVPDLLHRLVSKSLVVAHPKPDGTLRYGLSEVVRQLGREGLAGTGEARLRSRHAAYYAELTRALDVAEASLEARVDRMSAEYDNVRLALAWCAARDAALEADLVVHLRWFWRLRGCFQEARRWTLSALAGDQLGTASGAELHLDAAAWSRRSGDLAAAVTHLAHASSAAGRLQEPLLVGRIHLGRGILRALAGDLPGAERQFSRGTVALASASPGYVLAGLLNNLALVQSEMGRTDEALVNAERALALMAEQADGEDWLAEVLHTLGTVLLAAHRLDEARERFLQGLRCAAGSGDLPGGIALLTGLAGVAARESQASLCLELLAAAQSCGRLLEAGAAAQPGPPGPHAEQLSRSLLGQSAADEAWARGLRMSLQQAIQHALAEGGSGPALPLTRRKMQIVRLVAAGLGNKAIAQQLFISERTVEAHLDQVRRQLALRNRAQIAVWAASHGFV
jgi:predicted ATPase/DNA-binding NarL/FixJ family response regulator